MTNDGRYRLYYCNADTWCCCYEEWQQDLRLHDNYTTRVSNPPTHTYTTPVTSWPRAQTSVRVSRARASMTALQHHGQRRSTRFRPATRHVILGERWSVMDTVSADAWELQPCSALRCNISPASHPITRRLVARKERKWCMSYRFPAFSCLHVLSVIRSNCQECDVDKNNVTWLSAPYYYHHHHHRLRDPGLMLETASYIRAAGNHSAWEPVKAHLLILLWRRRVFGQTSEPYRYFKYNTSELSTTGLHLFFISTIFSKQTSRKLTRLWTRKLPRDVGTQFINMF